MDICFYCTLDKIQISIAKSVTIFSILTVCPYQQWLTYSRITIPFRMPQAAYPCGTIPHILTSLPYTYEWFIRQSGSFRFWANRYRGITCFQKSYKINDLFLCLYWQGGHLFKKIRSFHLLSHLRLVLTTISCYCLLTTRVQARRGFCRKRPAHQNPPFAD